MTGQQYIAGADIRFAALVALRDDDGMVYEARTEVYKEQLIGIACRPIFKGEVVILNDDAGSDIVTRQSIERA